MSKKEREDKKVVISLSKRKKGIFVAVEGRQSDLATLLCYAAKKVDGFSDVVINSAEFIKENKDDFQKEGDEEDDEDNEDEEDDDGKESDDESHEPLSKDPFMDVFLKNLLMNMKKDDVERLKKLLL